MFVWNIFLPEFICWLSNHQICSKTEVDSLTVHRSMNKIIIQNLRHFMTVCHNLEISFFGITCKSTELCYRNHVGIRKHTFNYITRYKSGTTTFVTVYITETWLIGSYRCEKKSEPTKYSSFGIRNNFHHNYIAYIKRSLIHYVQYPKF